MTVIKWLIRSSNSGTIFFFQKKKNSFPISQWYLTIRGSDPIAMRPRNNVIFIYIHIQYKKCFTLDCAMIVAQLSTEDCGVNKNITYGNDRAHAITISCIVCCTTIIVSMFIRARFNHISYTFDSLNTLKLRHNVQTFYAHVFASKRNVLR